MVVRKWTQLTPQEQRCWTALAFPTTDQPKGSATWFKPWRELSVAEGIAATALGWKCETWEGNEWFLPEDTPWSELSEATRVHLMILGETEEAWNYMFCGPTPAGFIDGGDMRTWKWLKDREKEAALELGFTPSTWNMEEMADVHAYLRDFS